MDDISRFDPAGPLPAGQVVLEASAGTGKTWTIAALVTRYVAEQGIPIEEILVVTFTRAATSELRERVRARLSDAARFLAGTDPDPGDDPVLESFGKKDPSARALYLNRIERALAGFDRATIATLHGFATRLLRGLGFASGAPQAAALAADHGELLAEAMSDMVIGRWAEGPDEPLPMRDLRAIARAVLGNPDADILPRAGDAEGSAAERADFARDLRLQLAVKSERAGILTYDDLLIRARDALKDPVVGVLARSLVGSRFRVALIDEFQDTDRVQWEVASLLFSGEGSTLVIIGDPKQAIYAFRGADVDAYLIAASRAEAHFTLDTNWRSDAGLVSGLDALFSGMEFGHPGITYRHVDAAESHQEAAVTGAGPPLRVRIVGRDSPLKTTRAGFSQPAAREFVAADVAAYVVELLAGPARIRPEGEDERRIAPGDIAVLCRTNNQVAAVSAALKACEVPAVVGRTGSVLVSPAAGEWETLLAALERPSSAPRVRRAAVGAFGGWEPARLLDASDDDLTPLYEMFSTWARTLQTRGVPALMGAIERDTSLTARVLEREGGERTLTDLNHLGEVLHATQRAGGIRSLADWLTREMAEAAEGSEESETRTRRLETDAAAVQLLTIHGSKGLEFPIVLAPFMWDIWRPSIAVPVFHPSGDAPREVDVGGKGNWASFAEHKDVADTEQRAEELRLMYVALTRARHHLGIWWSPCGPAKTAPISRILFGREPDGETIADEVTLHREDRLLGRLAPAVERSRGAIAADWFDTWAEPVRWEAPGDRPGDLGAARFDRPIDHTWRRTSFTGLTAAAHDAPPPPDSDAPGKDDEPAEAPEAAGPGSPLPMEDLPAGLHFGSLVHDILEDIDLAAPDRAERLDEVTLQAVADSGVEADPAALVAALDAVARTPLFPTPGSVALEDISGTDQVAEMGFEIPVAVDGAAIGLGDLADVLATHLPADDLLAEYPERLRSLGATRFRGFLSGFIDLTMRVDGRYWVTDYKTNRLSARAETADALDYAPGRIAAAMIDGDYALQALLYQVALHRFLRHRLPGYDPAQHLGGAMWLFVRGMIGPDTPEADGGRCGVFAWQPPPGLIPAVDALFAGGAG